MSQRGDGGPSLRQHSVVTQMSLDGRDIHFATLTQRLSMLFFQFQSQPLWTASPLTSTDKRGAGADSPCLYKHNGVSCHGPPLLALFLSACRRTIWIQAGNNPLYSHSTSCPVILLIMFQNYISFTFWYVNSGDRWHAVSVRRHWIPARKPAKSTASERCVFQCRPHKWKGQVANSDCHWPGPWAFPAVIFRKRRDPFVLLTLQMSFFPVLISGSPVYFHVTCLV